MSKSNMNNYIKKLEVRCGLVVLPSKLSPWEFLLQVIFYNIDEIFKNQVKIWQLFVCWICKRMFYQNKDVIHVGCTTQAYKSGGGTSGFWFFGQKPLVSIWLCIKKPQKPYGLQKKQVESVFFLILGHFGVI